MIILGQTTIVAAALRLPVPDELKSKIWNGQRMYPDFLTISAPPPARHGTLMHPLSDTYTRVVGPHNQGFLTSTGEFVDRQTAYQIVVAAKQQMIIHGSNIPGTLYSEDLW